MERLSEADKMTSTEYEFLDFFTKQIKEREKGREFLLKIPKKYNSNFDKALAHLLPTLSNCRNINYYFYDIIKLSKLRDSKIVIDALEYSFANSYDYDIKVDYIFYKSELLKSLLEIEGISFLPKLLNEITFNDAIYKEFNSYSKLRLNAETFFNESRNKFLYREIVLKSILNDYFNQIGQTEVERIIESENHIKFINFLLLQIDAEEFLLTEEKIENSNSIKINEFLSFFGSPIKIDDIEFDKLEISSENSLQILNDIISTSLDSVNSHTLNKIEFTETPSKIDVVNAVNLYFNSVTNKEQIQLSEFLVNQHLEYLSILLYSLCKSNYKLDEYEEMDISLASLVTKLKVVNKDKHRSLVSKKKYFGTEFIPDSLILLLRSGKYKLSIQHREYNLEDENYYEYLRIDDYNNKTSYFKYVSKIPLKYLRLLKSYPYVFDDLEVSLFEYELQSAFGKKFRSRYKWEIFDSHPSFLITSVINGGFEYGNLVIQNLANHTSFGTKDYNRDIYSLDIYHPSKSHIKFTYDSIASSIDKALKYVEYNNSTLVNDNFKDYSKIFLDSTEFATLKNMNKAIQTEVLNKVSQKQYFGLVKDKFSNLCNPRENEWYEFYRIEPSHIDKKKRFKSNWIANSTKEIDSLNTQLKKLEISNYSELNRIDNIIPLRLFFNQDTTEVIGYNLIKTDRGKKLLQFTSKLESNFALRDDLIELMNKFPNFIYLSGFDLFQTSKDWLLQVNNALNFGNDQLYDNNIVKALNQNGYKNHIELSEIDLNNFLFLFDYNYGSIVFEEISFIKNLQDKIPFIDAKWTPSETTIKTINSFKTELLNLSNKSSEEPKQKFVQNFNRDTRDWCDSGFFIGVTVSSDSSFQNMQVTGFYFQPQDFNGLVVNIGVNAIFNQYFKQSKQ